MKKILFLASFIGEIKVLAQGYRTTGNKAGI